MFGENDEEHKTSDVRKHHRTTAATKGPGLIGSSLKKKSKTTRNVTFREDVKVLNEDQDKSVINNPLLKVART